MGLSTNQAAFSLGKAHGAWRIGLNPKYPGLLRHALCTMPYANQTGSSITNLAPRGVLS